MKAFSCPVGFSEVDVSRIDEVVKLKGTSKWAWPRIGGGWVVRFNDRHGDCWNIAMPKWWTPEHQETMRDERDGSTVPARWVSEGCNPFDSLSHHYKRITAELHTGKEIAA